MTKRRRSDWPQQLRQIQLITADSSDGVIMIDVNQRIRWANAAALAMHGVTTADDLGGTIDAYHSRFGVRFRAAPVVDSKYSLDSVACGETFRDVVVEVTPLDGQAPHWVYRVRNLVIVDDDTNPTCIVQLLRPLEGQGACDRVATTTDATTQPNGAGLLAGLPGEAGARMTRESVTAMCAMAPIALHVLDRDMRIVAVSQPWLDWLGQTEDAVIGRRITEFMSAESAEHFESHTVRSLEREASMPSMASEFVTGTGKTTEALLSASVVVDEHGAPSFVIAAPVDISERKRCEDAFSAAFMLAPVPMLIRTLDDPRILDANDAFIALTGFAPGAVIGHGIDELGLFENRAQKAQFETNLRAQDAIQNQTVKLKTGHNEVLECLLSARRIHAFGRTAVLLILQDVSDRRRSEEQLFEAIETVMQDTTWFSRSVIEKLAALRSPVRSGVSHAEISDLTPREREVLGLISQGLADLEISTKLGLTRSTVRNHVATLYSKIGVHSRSSAIIWARERGINVAWPTTRTTPRSLRGPAPRQAPASALSAKPRGI
jgi:PAS domain S-box-containing protein